MEKSNALVDSIVDFSIILLEEVNCEFGESLYLICIGVKGGIAEVSLETISEHHVVLEGESFCKHCRIFSD